MAQPYPHKAHYYETDQMGIIHHSNYIRWFEEARLDYLRQSDVHYKKLEEQNIIIPVLEVQATYKTMVQFDDTVWIHCSVGEYTGTRMTINYVVTDHENKVIYTTGYSKHCFLNKNHRLVNVKKKHPEVHQAFLTMQQ